MKIAAILNVHDDSPIVFDTLESIRRWMTHDVLVICDGAGWHKLEKVKLPVHKLEGLYHACNRAPYRNIVLALKHAGTIFPDADWYCYMEYDCLVASSGFGPYLQAAEKEKIWCLGNDYRTGNIQFPLLESIFETNFLFSHYLLGACVFHHRDFVKKLFEIDFFDKFLFYTNDFSKGFFPGYEEQGGYDFGEHLFPTLAAHYGGVVNELAKFTEADQKWHGYHEQFPIRFRPDIDVNYKKASILHPIKDFLNPIRIYHRKLRGSSL